METCQVVQMEEDQFMEARESPLREVDSVVIHDNVNEIVSEIEREDPETLIIERELKELDLVQQREHNFQSLDSALKRKQYVLSKAKAKEEVELCTLQNDIDELCESRKYTEKEIETLKKQKKELQVSVEIGALELLQTQKRVENTSTALHSLKSNYKNLEQFEQLTAQDISSLNSVYDSLVNYYCTEKERHIKKIYANKEIIKNTRLEIEDYMLKDNAQIKALQKSLEMFLKNEKEEEEALVRLNKKHDDSLKQFYNNQLELFKEELECKNLQDKIDNIDLDRIKKQKTDEKFQQNEILENQTKKLARAKERFMEVENCNKLLEDKLEEDRQNNNKLQEKLLTLDNEKVNLISERLKIQENINKVSQNLKSNQDLNESKMTQVAGELSQSHMDMDVIAKKKEEFAQQLESLQEDYNNSLKILENLLQLENECQETIQTETQKRREMEERSLMLEDKLKTSKLSLTEIQDRIKSIKSLRLADSQQLADRLNKAKEKLTKVAQDGETKIKACLDERNTYEWNFEETKKDNIGRNQRELCKLKENSETLEQTLEENKQKIEQLKETIKDKNEECWVLKKDIDELKLAELVKKPLQSSIRGAKPKVKETPPSSQNLISDISNITLDTTTTEESETEGGEFTDMFSELRSQLSKIQ